jgi:hypothetical protein
MTTPDASPEAWRPVIAALGDPAARRVFAEIALDEAGAAPALSASRRRHALDRLIAAGLVADGDPGPTLDTAVFSRVLAAAPRAARPTGIHRFLRADGRIDRYPSAASDRRALLEHIAHAVLSPGDVVDERAFGERLARFSDDAAALRRYLVDEGLVERTRAGSEYALADA